MCRVCRVCRVCRPGGVTTLPQDGQGAREHLAESLEVSWEAEVALPEEALQLQDARDATAGAHSDAGVVAHEEPDAIHAPWNLHLALQNETKAAVC